MSELEFVTNAAHWDYQRDRIYVRSGTRLKRVRKKSSSSTPTWRVDCIVECAGSDRCPHCNRKGSRHGQPRRNTRQEILFGRFSLKRRVVQYREQQYWCAKCRKIFGADKIPRKRGQSTRYDRSLHAYLFYQTIELGIPAQTAAETLRRIFGLDLTTATIALFKTQMAEYYMKAIARLREVIRGSSTEKGIKEYLTLLSVCQTCKYSGVDFLDFLRSGEKDLHAFAESRRKRRPARATPPATVGAQNAGPRPAEGDSPAS